MRTRRLFAAFIAGLPLGGCASPYSTFNPAGDQAQWLATVGWWLIALMTVLIVAMGVLVLWPALSRKRRGSLQEHAPVDADGGKYWILIGGVAIPVAVLTGLFILTVVTLNAFPGQVQRPELEVEVTAHQWWWEVDYLNSEPSMQFSTANEIHIPVGQPVGVQLNSADVIHSFWVPKLHGKMDAIPGHENYIVLEATEPGVYRGQCAEYCGVQHSNMKFTVVAQRPEEYQAWAENQSQPAREPSNPLQTKGRDVFEQYACAMCHTIRGTKARGSVAPDLTHIASRQRIAGTIPNTRARLQAWAVDAQAFKPGVHMPTLDQLSGEELNALGAYLESLK